MRPRGIIHFGAGAGGAVFMACVGRNRQAGIGRQAMGGVIGGN